MPVGQYRWRCNHLASKHHGGGSRQRKQLSRGKNSPEGYPPCRSNAYGLLIFQARYSSGFPMPNWPMLPGP